MVLIDPVDRAFNMLCSLMLEDGRRWGDAAVDVQVEDARAVLDPDGVPFHFLTRSRGHSKTSDLAGIVLSVMLTQLQSGSRLYALAADRDQGALLVDAVAGFVARTTGLGSALQVNAFRVTAASGSVLEVIPADAASSWGLKPSFAVVDEIAQWESTAGPRKLWEAMSSAMAKVKGSRMVVLTSAGDPAHWSHKVLEHAERSKLWHVHQVPGPPPWADPERLEEQRSRLPESSYRRLFLNEWTSAEDRLTSLDDLRACVSLEGPLSPEPNLRYVCGLHIGLKNDATVAAICHAEKVLDSSGSVRSRRVVLDRMETWQGSKRHPVDLGVVEAWLLEAYRQYRIDIVADPWQAIGMCQRLRSRGVRVREYPLSQQSVGRLATTLHTCIRDHHLALPDDKDLLDELANVRLRETSTPGVLRLDSDPDKHDDRAVALALGVWYLLENAPKRKGRMYRLALNEGGDGAPAEGRPKARMVGPTVAERAHERASRRVGSVGERRLPKRPRPNHRPARSGSVAVSCARSV